MDGKSAEIAKNTNLLSWWLCRLLTRVFFMHTLMKDIELVKNYFIFVQQTVPCFEYLCLKSIKSIFFCISKLMICIGWSNCSHFLCSLLRGKHIKIAFIPIRIFSLNHSGNYVLEFIWKWYRHCVSWKMNNKFCGECE